MNKTKFMEEKSLEEVKQEYADYRIEAERKINALTETQLNFVDALKEMQRLYHQKREVKEKVSL